MDSTDSNNRFDQRPSPIEAARRVDEQDRKASEAAAETEARNAHSRRAAALNASRLAMMQAGRLVPEAIDALRSLAVEFGLNVPTTGHFEPETAEIAVRTHAMRAVASMMELRQAASYSDSDAQCVALIERLLSDVVNPNRERTIPAGFSPDETKSIASSSYIAVEAAMNQVEKEIAAKKTTNSET